MQELEAKIQEALAAGDIDEADAREIRRIQDAANREIIQYLPKY